MAYPDDGDPIRLRCLERLKTDLEGIRRSQGYAHDMKVVYLLQSEKLVNGEYTPGAVIVDDGLDELVNETTCQNEHAMPLSVFVCLRAIGGAPGEWVRRINWLVADVQRALALDSQLDGNALYTDVLGRYVFESPIDNLAAAELKLRVVYRTLVEDPASITA